MVRAEWVVPSDKSVIYGGSLANGLTDSPYIQLSDPTATAGEDITVCTPSMGHIKDVSSVENSIFSQVKAS